MNHPPQDRFFSSANGEPPHEDRHTRNRGIRGQRPLTTGLYLWLFAVIVMWASNAVVVKIALRDLPPFWYALIHQAGSTLKGDLIEMASCVWMGIYIVNKA